ncbi:unnamed protein product [Lepeophtheirus salmonis]|uniref:(salmon louse) hypothetical protein n=1 Tax=Lepeophtheirus salmonis TaxID=72036 RepID=A0A7R8CF88_LEPSM|nr:unnamed protein product [Lepeophtheirus salmonis]CAF2764092.1 unnamed protein product [Lepeophtheirus salmonis]
MRLSVLLFACLCITLVHCQKNTKIVPQVKTTKGVVTTTPIVTTTTAALQDALIAIVAAHGIDIAVEIRGYEVFVQKHVEFVRQLLPAKTKSRFCFSPRFCFSFFYRRACRRTCGVC